jgi:glycerol uptake facilitator-like aquaporin
VTAPLSRRVVAEFAGTLFLLANTIATGAALVAIILAFSPISGAHLNPAVTLADAWQGGIALRETSAYIAAQIAGAFAGVATAHLMFGLPLFSASAHARTGTPQLFSEFVATIGLLSVIWGCVRQWPSAVPSPLARTSSLLIGSPRLRPSPTPP